MACTCKVQGLEEVEKMYRVNVLCIVDSHHQRCAIVVDHFIKFKGI